MLELRRAVDPRQEVTYRLLSTAAVSGPLLVAYRDPRGREPFCTWYAALDPHAAAKVAVTLGHLAAGNRSETKAVGSGVLERRIHWGPGYRIYFGLDGTRLVVLLGGGTKKRQQRDITTAQARWQDYKARRKQEESGE
jgi:putative addiction module killer protein